jgi:hypothetical protein
MKTTDISLTGSYTIEPSSGGIPGFYALKLENGELLRLAEAIELMSSNQIPLNIYIDGHELKLLPVSINTFKAEKTKYENLLITSSIPYLIDLAQRLRWMAAAPEDPDYLVHVHLDLFYSRTDEDTPDIIIERKDKQ